MLPHLNFDQDIMRSIVGGTSAIDMPKLSIKNLEAATSFIKNYGFDIDKPEVLEKVWYYHKRATSLIREKLLVDGEEIPEELTDPKKLEDIRSLLVFASSTDKSQKKLQRWSCAILRVMHIFVHAENDLFSFFSEDIQKQILTPLQACIFHDGMSGKTILRHPEKSIEEVVLNKFEIKSFKMSSSTVIKLLAKADMLAIKIYDKLGVRFVTDSLFDTFRVVRFLIEHDLVAFPHVMPDQSSNTLYPLELLFEVTEKLKNSTQPLHDELIEEEMVKLLEERKDQIIYLRKQNNFSSDSYRFIKFIARKLIHIDPAQSPNGKELSFFYPFEVQIVDSESYQLNFTGEEAHSQYKERQKAAARKRIFIDL